MCEGAASPITRRAIPTPELRVSVVLPPEEGIQVIRNETLKKSSKNITCIHSYLTVTSNFFNDLVGSGRNIMYSIKMMSYRFYVLQVIFKCFLVSH